MFDLGERTTVLITYLLGLLFSETPMESCCLHALQPPGSENNARPHPSLICGLPFWDTGVCELEIQGIGLFSLGPMPHILKSRHKWGSFGKALCRELTRDF